MALSCCAFIVSSSTGVRKRCGGGRSLLPLPLRRGIAGLVEVRRLRR